MLTTDYFTISLLVPEIVLVVMAAWIFVGGTLARSRGGWTLFALAALAVAGTALVLQAAPLHFHHVWVAGRIPAGLLEHGALVSTSGPLAVDFLGHAFALFGVAFGLLFTLTAARGGGESYPEYLGSLLLVVAGWLLVVKAEDLVLLFVGLELISIPTYVMLYLGRRDDASSEATMKYFFLSVLSSAVLLYGLSFLYGMAGSTHLKEIAAALSVSEDAALTAVLAPLTLVLIFAGLGFKIAAAPMHFYAPDVYQGTTHANAAVLAVAPKIAGFVVLVRLAILVFPALGEFGWQLALALAMLTMTLGNVAALWQRNLRRLLAYSSIAHSGYLLIGLAAALAAPPGSAASVAGITAVLFYLIAYALATTGAFAALEALRGGGEEAADGATTLDDLAGLSRRRPLLAAALAVLMFSLTGVPIFIGFWGKLTLFTSAIAVAQTAESSAVAGWFVALAVAGVLNAAVSAGYYLRVVGAMYFSEPAGEAAPPRWSAAGLAAALCALMVVGYGVIPGHWIDRMRFAAQSAVAERPAADRLSSFEASPGDGAALMQAALPAEAGSSRAAAR